MPKPQSEGDWRGPCGAACRIAVLYAACSLAWIFCSGWLLHRFVQDPSWVALLESLKGTLFVLATALVLGLALRRYFQLIQDSSREIEENEQRWRFALDGAGHGVWDWNVQTNEVFLSPQWKAMLGFNREELENSIAQWEALVHPEDLPGVWKQIRAHLEGKSNVYVSEFRLRCKDNSYKWIRAQGMVMSRTADGTPVRMLGTHSDITRVKESELNEHQAAARLRQLSRAVEQNPASIMITDRSGTVEYVNPKFTQVSGYASSEIAGKNPRLLKSGMLPKETYDELWATILAGKEWCGELLNRKKSGELYWEYASISPILDESGQARHFVAVKEDITGRKHLEAQLRQAQKLEAIGQLAGGVAHDFNNILAAIMMHIGLLQMTGQLNEEVRQSLKEIEGGVERASSLTRQLLMFSRRSVLSVNPIDLDKVVSDLTRMLKRLIGEQIKLQHDSRPGLPAIEADAGMMEQVVMNLVLNARDAMPNGGEICIATSVAEFDSENALENPERRGGMFVCLSVSDTGCGMDAATLKRVFEPFFTTKPVGKGTGLGLATVHGIVAQHKGWVEVESEVGRGSTFRVFLPVAARLSETTARSAPEPVPHGSETILVVEDDIKVRLALAQTLRLLGYRVHQAGNGQEAMTLWQAHGEKINLLLTDMVMPEGMTGLDLAQRLQKCQPELKVIISSGYAGEIVRSGVPNKPGIVYLPKPYDTKVLARILRGCLDEEEIPKAEGRNPNT